MDAWDRALGHRFRNPLLLERALTHRSWSAGQGEEGDWERLEFLGDALLGFVVAEWLWRRAPEATEGDLTRRKQEVVRREALERAARRLGLGSRLRLGRGEEASGGRERASLLADSFEAVVGAVYVDGGVRAARSFIVRHLRPELETALGGASGDLKTLLQERVQARWRRTPRYRIVSTAGPAHAPRFTSEVLVGDKVVGVGSGPTRKQAEQEAAGVALSRLPDVL